MTQLACMFLFFTLVHALQPFATPSSVSLFIPLQTVLLRTPTELLSVELWILIFSNMFASMFLVFSMLCLSSISYLFFKPFPAFSDGFSRVSFLQFPHFPNGFLNFLGFSKLAMNGFFNIQPFATPSSANRLAPNPNGRCSPLSFGSLVFQYACLYAPSCLKALHCASISYLFFKPFPAFLRFFQSFLPAISSFSQWFPQFSLVLPSLPFIFCSSFMVFHNFPPFSSIFTLFLTIFLHFPWFFPTFFRLPFSRDLGRIEPHHLVAHAPLKNSNWPP